MKNKFKLFWIIAIVAIIGFSTAACGEDDGGSTPQSEKWVSVDEDGDTWTLTITEKAGRLTAKQGDTYKLEVDSASEGNLKSEGEVQSNTSGKILLKPNNATETFEVTTSGKEMTSVSGTVTFDNGDRYKFDTPWNLTPTDGKAATPTATPPQGTYTTAQNVTLASATAGASIYYSLNGSTPTASSTRYTTAISISETTTLKAIAVKEGMVNSDVLTAVYTIGGSIGNWEWIKAGDSTFERNNMSGIAWGGNKFVAVGGGWTSNNIAYSEDGITWTKVTDTKITEHIDAIAWGGDKFVAIDTYGQMAYSTDGITWTAVNNPKGGGAIAYGNGKFVTLGSYSSDGITWTAVNKTVVSGNGIAYGNGKFVAGGVDGKMAYSLDGITWTAGGEYDFGYMFPSAIAWNGTRFVAVGGSGNMAYSSDGITWTAVANSTITDFIAAIAWGGGRFIAGGDMGKMAYSTDGITWTAITNTPFSRNMTSIRAIAWGSNKFVASGAGGDIYYCEP